MAGVGDLTSSRLRPASRAATSSACCPDTARGASPPAAYVCVCMYIYIHIYIHIYMYIYMYMYRTCARRHEACTCRRGCTIQYMGLQPPTHGAAAFNASHCSLKTKGLQPQNQRAATSDRWRHGGTCEPATNAPMTLPRAERLRLMLHASLRRAPSLQASLYLVSRCEYY